MHNGPLTGIRVLDLSAAVAGPWASTQLADQGAEVVLVEKTAEPDVMRLTGAVSADQSGSWVAMHRNKRAIALDLRHPDGIAAALRLAATVDVVIQNFRPGVADRLGIGYDSVAELNPDVIYLSVSGFGPTGPYAGQPVYDPIVQALSGMADAQGGDYVKAVLVDKTTAMTAANAVLAALVARGNGAGGQHVEVNLLDSMLAWSWLDVYWNDALPEATPTPTYSEWYSPYDTRDGKIATVWTSFGQFRAAAAAVGRPELADDPRFATRDLRLRHSTEMRAEFAAALSQMTTEEAIDSLRAHDVPSAPVLSREQVLHDPQVRHNGTIVEDEHPTAGRMRYVRPPARFSATPSRVHRPSPGKGEHTAEVLREVGYDDETLDRLREQGVIAEHT